LLASVGGLRATDVMGARGEPSLPVAGVTLDETSPGFEAEAEASGRARRRPSPEAEAEAEA
jgi:hypothetical protein